MRLAVSAAAVAIVSFGCSSDEDPGDNDDTASGTEEGPESPGSVEASAQCARGDTLASAPVDTDAIGILDRVADDTAWVQRIVTVENASDSPARLDSEAVVRYLDESGAVITEQALNEPYPPSLSAAPGQTVNRSTTRFDVPSQGGLVLDQPASTELFSGLDSCEFAEEPALLPVADDEFIDAELAGHVDVVECGPTQDGTRYEGSFRVQNTSGNAFNVELGFEILDANGERLGTGGNESDPVPADGEATITGFAAGFTVLDIDDAVDCAVLSAAVVG